MIYTATVTLEGTVMDEVIDKITCTCGYETERLEADAIMHAETHIRVEHDEGWVKLQGADGGIPYDWPVRGGPLV